MKKVLIAMLLVCVAFTAFAQGAGEAKGDVITLRLASNHATGFVTSVACEKFAELVEEKTNGTVKVECYFDAVLGEEKATIEQCQYGGIDIVRVNIAPVTEFVDELNAINFPYIFANSEHYWNVMNSPEVGQALLTSKGMTDAGLLGLCYYDNGTRNFFFSKKSVTVPADMKNLAVRVQESALMMGMVKAMGANPVAMTGSELYSALQTGVVDGAENNLPWYLSMSLNEVAPLITMDMHTRSADMLIISTKTLEKLSDEQVQAIKEAAAESSLYQRELWAQSEIESRETCLAKGCTIIDLTDEQIALYMDCVKELNAKEGAKYADIFAKIAALQ